MWQKRKVAFFNGKAFLCFTSHQRGWHMEVPCSWKSLTVFLQLTNMIWPHFVALKFLPAESDSRFSGGGAIFIMWNTVCDALPGCNLHPAPIYTGLGYQKCCWRWGWGQVLGHIFVSKQSTISRNALETGPYALPEILMRRLSAVADAKWYFVFMEKTRGEHDKSVLLDDLERYKVISFDPYWTQIKFSSTLAMGKPWLYLGG